MIAHLQDLISRHRRKLIIAGALASGSIIAIKITKNKLLESHEKQMKYFFERSHRMQHFESIEQACNQIIKDMSSELTSFILEECSTDELLKKLHRNDPNKIRLWEETKITVFTRLTTLIYALSMLVIALRVQMNILGGYLYSDIKTNKRHMTDKLEHQYLSLIRYFIRDIGIKKLLEVVRTKVQEVFGPLELNRRLTIEQLEQLFWSLQVSLNNNEKDNCNISKYLLISPLPEYISSNSILSSMYFETLDLLESDDAIKVCAFNISRGFSLAKDAIAECLNQNEVETNLFKDMSDDQQQRSYNICNLETAIAKLIPIVNCITSKYNLATLLISFYVTADKSKAFGANVYEAFSNGI